MDELLMSNKWWAWFIDTYTFSIALIFALLKCLAILDKSTETNKVVDYLQGMFPITFNKRKDNES
jgi:hypothetical protein